ncbi:hypothetical protein HKBW3S43_00220 [Candidatus Hakubella thermalkaliphila]|uniref:DUF433 domain-containing protein n=1 Tax=Candidatus Hakubella thermalkaliphila TaxID=2754717 RepID=A0A6V8P810_9ACTN|nr:DUF433 domain-containing protein [Candidatus Hakubella thermalkaliphila]GFP20979.1 hypothetical protein HKBW3S06_00205 [Candidatus Hakubella thermalkaliphila]GFP24868.1 hypothetical protein HKBW3S25_00306 [Candidatus Hakubella thermalkaliphila]GFP26906.1 hypothetical protein HKBW3S33_00320 [Candidatus Hakubella thermalkaliphila]GFP34427.1 hypothetical protein HKBW3S43_00220 [Candidatus Hakubella thermalkaliphila]GFP43678.1 hypothetical protein HKBW3C_02807 [Candidatus Hakubella thermalkalip
MGEAIANLEHKYVTVGKDREAFIRGTRVKVKNLIIHYKSGMPIEEILEGFPNIAPAQLFDALSYYHDNQQEIEASIRRDDLKEIKKEFKLELQLDGTLKRR